MTKPNDKAVALVQTFINDSDGDTVLTQHDTDYLIDLVSQVITQAREEGYEQAIKVLSEQDPLYAESDWEGSVDGIACDVHKYLIKQVKDSK